MHNLYADRFNLFFTKESYVQGSSIHFVYMQNKTNLLTYTAQFYM